MVLCFLSKVLENVSGCATASERVTLLGAAFRWLPPKPQFWVPGPVEPADGPAGFGGFQRGRVLMGRECHPLRAGATEWQQGSRAAGLQQGSSTRPSRPCSLVLSCPVLCVCLLMDE